MARVELLAESSDRPALARWADWCRPRWPALAAILIALPLFVVVTAANLGWSERPFPGFFVMGNRIVPTIGLYEWTGLRAGMPYLSEITAVDGRRVTTNREVYDFAASLPYGTKATYTTRHADRTASYDVATMRFTSRDFGLTIGLFLVCGVLSLGLGITVRLLKPTGDAARAFFVQGTTTGLYALTGTALYPPDTWWLAAAYCVVQTFVPASFIHLALVFPVPRRFVERNRRWLALPYVIAALLSVWLLVDFLGEPPRVAALKATFAFMAVGLACFATVPAYAYWENRNLLVRPQLRAVVPGMAFSATVAFWAHFQVARGDSFPLNLMTPAVPLFYASIAYSILRHDLFDIDRILKLALVYAVVSLALLALHAIIVAMVGDWISLSPGRSLALAVVVAVVLVEPLRRYGQAAVDRLFYRGRVDYRATVKEISTDLTTLLDRDQILTRIARAIADGLQVESFSVGLWASKPTQVWELDRAAGGLVAREPTRAWQALEAQLTSAPSRPWSVVDDEAELRAVIVVPLAIRGRTVGAFALGRRLSGGGFSRDDLDLLATLAAQSAISLENARSYGDLQVLNRDLESKVRERTAQLEASYNDLKDTQAQLVQAEKMASLGTLTAGVAHEINNPVTFVVNSVRPLEDILHEVEQQAGSHPELGLDGLLKDARDIVGMMSEGARRTADVVRALRTFSRLGGDQPERVDLRAAIETTLRLLHSRWAGRIQVHWEVVDHDPVEAIPGQLNQVLMNVLANACDAIADKGNIWIGVRPESDGVLLTIRDDGCGIDAATAAKAFDPFFTTKPQGQGTGLGLAIAHGVIAKHGGRIALRALDGAAGAEVSIWLPASASMAAAGQASARTIPAR